MESLLLFPSVGEQLQVPWPTPRRHVPLVHEHCTLGLQKLTLAARNSRNSVFLLFICPDVTPGRASGVRCLTLVEDLGR